MLQRVLKLLDQMLDDWLTTRGLKQTEWITRLQSQKSKILFKLGQHQEAITLVKSLLKKDIGNHQFWVQLHVYSEVTDPSMSAKALFKAYKVDPASPLVLNMLMFYYFKQ